MRRTKRAAARRAVRQLREASTALVVVVRQPRRLVAEVADDHGRRAPSARRRRVDVVVALVAVDGRVGAGAALRAPRRRGRRPGRRLAAGRRRFVVAGVVRRPGDAGATLRERAQLRHVAGGGVALGRTDALHQRAAHRERHAVTECEGTFRCCC